MLTAMFAKFPSLPDTEKAGSSETDDGTDEHAGWIRDNIAGHGSRSLDWHSLRAKLSAERDLRGSLRGENEAMASWIRAEGSFDPRAAEALCGHSPGQANPAQSAETAGHVEGTQAASGDEEKATTRLPDPKPSQPITGSGRSVPTDEAGSAPGLSVED